MTVSFHMRSVMWPANKEGEAMVKNHYRADHKVYDNIDGYNVRLTYKGHEVSLASDGGDTIVFEGLSPILFTSIGTTGEAIKACFDFIDSLEK